MPTNRGSRTYFTELVDAPFHKGGQPGQIDFEDVFETFALRDELGTEGGNTSLQGWVYHNFPDLAGRTIAAMLCPIPANAQNLERIKFFVSIESGITPEVIIRTCLVTDSEVTPGNTSSVTPNSILMGSLLASTNGFGLNIYQLVTPQSVQTTLYEADTKIAKDESQANLSRALNTDDFRMLLVEIQLSPLADLGNSVKVIGFQYS